ARSPHGATSGSTTAWARSSSRNTAASSPVYAARARASRARAVPISRSFGVPSAPDRHHRDAQPFRDLRETLPSQDDHFNDPGLARGFFGQAHVDRQCSIRALFYVLGIRQRSSPPSRPGQTRALPEREETS